MCVFFGGGGKKIMDFFHNSTHLYLECFLKVGNLNIEIQNGPLFLTFLFGWLPIMNPSLNPKSDSIQLLTLVGLVQMDRILKLSNSISQRAQNKKKLGRISPAA